MDPLTLGGVAAGFLGGMFSGNNSPNPGLPSQTRLMSPEQLAFLNSRLRALMAGQGDFGFGAAARQGNATLQQMMAARGISPTSGVYNSALARMMSQAMSQDVANRQQYGLNLISSRPATASGQKWWFGAPGQWERGWGG